MSDVQMLGDLLCGRVEDMPDVIKDDSSRLPTGLGPGMVQVSVRLFPALAIQHMLSPAACSSKCASRSEGVSG